MTTPPEPEFIVAEMSKNWLHGREVQPGTGLIAEQFERVLEVNRRRGYRLLTFQVVRMMTTPEMLNETIIAVFEKVERGG